MQKLIAASLAALLLSACGTTQQKAEVEDRSTDATPSAATVPADNTGASTAGTDDAAVSGSAIDDAGDPRKVPGSLLSERSVYFDFDSFVVKDNYRPMLEAHAGYLNGRSTAKLLIQGNTDDRGSREYNLALGQKRAEAVRKSLGVLGVADAQLEAVSFGEERPRLEGQNEEAWAANRRADLVYADE